MSESPDGWFMRARGRVLGPFTLAQLLSLRDRGQLSQFHEVSRDRRTWIPAVQVPELFAGGTGVGVPGASAGPDQYVYGVVEESGAGSGIAAADAAPGWFYSYGSGHSGPVQLAALQHLADSGEVGPSTLVWRTGLPNWVPAHQVSELRFAASVTVPPGSAIGPMHQPAQVALNQPSRVYMPHTSGLAIASLVLGLLWLCGIGSLLATIFGAVAISQISRSNGMMLGKGMAVAGLVLGILGLAVYALPFTLAFLQTFLPVR